MAQQTVTYIKTHPVSGREMERVATTPSEQVALEFDGWVKKDRRSKSATTSTGSKSGSTSNS